MKFIAASGRTFPMIEEFIAPHEYKCVTLASHIRKKDEHIFIISKNDSVQSAEDIVGVIYFEKTLLHCIPNIETQTLSFPCQTRESSNEIVESSSTMTNDVNLTMTIDLNPAMTELAQALLQFFEAQKVFTKNKIKVINGESIGTDFILSILQTKSLEPQQTNHYKLMTLDEYLLPPPEPLSCDDEIRRCNDNDFDSLFELQKKYIVKEVAPANKQVSDLECSASLKQILKNQLCFALYSDGEVVAKANTNAIGIHWVQLGGVYTHPLYRKNYYAWNLVYAICGRIKKTNRKVCLFVKDKNNPALQLYHRIGFTEKCDFEICYF